MAYIPKPIPIQDRDLRAYIGRELALISQEFDEPNPRSLRLQRFDETPAKPRDGDIYYFPAIAGGFDPGSGFGIYWFDGARYRLVAGLDESAILAGIADDVTILDPPDFVPIVNYAGVAASPGMTVDAALGTITLPNIAGWVTFNVFVRINQITASKDFSVIGFLEVNAATDDPFGSAYIPQQSSDIDLFLNGGFARPVAGGEVIRVLLQLDGALTADFQILDTSIELRYAADLSSDSQVATLIPGKLP